jgi:hypothetical protein
MCSVRDIHRISPRIVGKRPCHQQSPHRPQLAQKPYVLRGQHRARALLRRERYFHEEAVLLSGTDSIDVLGGIDRAIGVVLQEKDWAQGEVLVRDVPSLAVRVNTRRDDRPKDDDLVGVLLDTLF